MFELRIRLVIRGLLLDTALELVGFACRIIRKRLWVTQPLAMSPLAGLLMDVALRKFRKVLAAHITGPDPTFPVCNGIVAGSHDKFNFSELLGGVVPWLLFHMSLKSQQS